jgi:ribosomal protein S18 acetylase RimI-like enzyme
VAVTVTSFRPEHRAAVRDLLVEHGWEEPFVTGQLGALDWLADEPVDGRAFTAVVQGEPAGYVSVQFHHWNRLAQIHGLAVRARLHRRGIASALVAEAEQAARAWGARGVYVDTPVTNAAGRAFYEALGYREAYTMPRYYADGVDGVTYQRFFDVRDSRSRT